MSYTDNPVADAERHIAKQEALLQRLPKCSYCGHRIQDEKLCVINDELICVSCMEQHFIKWTEDYIE